jgi:hypothetical protein
VQPSGPFKRSIFRNRFHPDGLASRFRWMPASGREPTETLLRQAACGAKLPLASWRLLRTRLIRTKRIIPSLFVFGLTGQFFQRQLWPADRR